MENFTIRQKAYRSLRDPLSFADAARELGVTEEKLSCFVREGRLKTLSGNLITGSALADFLQHSAIPAKRRK